MGSDSKLAVVAVGGNALIRDQKIIKQFPINTKRRGSPLPASPT